MAYLYTYEYPLIKNYSYRPAFSKRVTPLERVEELMHGMLQ
jgi:hypothetical protein